MITELPFDVLRIVFHCLLDDPVSICRFEMTCRSNCQLVRNSCSPELFQEMLNFRWRTGNQKNYSIDDILLSFDWMEEKEMEHVASWAYHKTNHNNPRDELERRYKRDQIAIQCVNEMAEIMATKLFHIKKSAECDSSSSSSTMKDVLHPLGESWNNANWTLLFELRLDAYDILKSIAKTNHHHRHHAINDKDVLKQNVRRFVSARTAASMHMSQCLMEWKKITSSSNDECRATQIENFALLVAKAQMTPLELLDETSPMEVDVTKQLDQIADKCRSIITSSSGIIIRDKEKLLVISEVLFGEMGFTRNEEDYFNYKNSLLNCVLQSKKGLPITLAILFTCVARRLNIVVDMIDFPGYVVLGFFDDTTSNSLYIDVCHGGKLMKLEQFQRIPTSHGWDEFVARPLNAFEVNTRILNNLIHCHEQMTILSITSLFREALAFQAQQLMMAYQMPSTMEHLLLGPPLTMCEDLLEMYDLFPVK